MKCNHIANGNLAGARSVITVKVHYSVISKAIKVGLHWQDKEP